MEAYICHLKLVNIDIHWISSGIDRGLVFDRGRGREFFDG